MSEVKHTPGPWAFEHNSASQPNSAAIDVRAVGGRYRGGVCSLYSAEHIDGVTFGEAEANAHLIAAAPDLLEKLREILEYASDGNQIPIVVQDEAEAIVAKALGK